MGKIIAAVTVTLDGYFAGTAGEIDWHVLGPAHRAYSIELLDEADALLFGRITYEGMAEFWPEPAGMDCDPEIARRMNGLRKLVISSTMTEAGWSKTEVLGGRLAEAIGGLREDESAGTIVILGSGSLIAQLTVMGLIDEYRFLISPVILGGGWPLFRESEERVPLRLLETRALEGGNIAARYVPA